MSAFRRGVRLGIDVGSVRVGVARTDPDGILAFPVATVPRNDQTISRVLALIAEYEPLEVLVGLPISLRGEETTSTADARYFAQQLAADSAPAVRLIDERLTTVSAQSALRASGRTVKGSRKIVDQVAAVVLLQHAMDVEKRTGEPAGPIADEEST